MNKLSFFTRVLKVAISISGIMMSIGWIIAPMYWDKPFSYLMTIVLPFVPDFLEKIGIKFSAQLVMAYEIFLVVAMVLGIDLNWYRDVLVTADQNSYYDKIVHFASGFLAVSAGEEVFSRYQRQSSAKNTPKWFHALFLISVAALIAVSWECFEFLYDVLFDGNMQELVKSGVSDTMWDMIVSLIGGSISTSFICSRTSPSE